MSETYSAILHLAFHYAVLVILAISSLNVYSIILSGWSSGTKYAYLGGLRSASQMISYEVAISLIILPVVFFSKSMQLTDFSLMQRTSLQLVWIGIPLFIILVISLLAETNRAPFDLPEAEAELVAGYNVEYSSTAFALFFLAEYSNMLISSGLINILFLGQTSSNVIFAVNVILVSAFFVLVRATFPRYRYNQLMQIGWQINLPLTLAFFIYLICL